MTTIARRSMHVADLVLPGLLLCGLGGVIALQLGLVDLVAADSSLSPAVVMIAPRVYSYRETGDFQRDGLPVDAPIVTIDSPPPLEIMTYEVSAADYARCVGAGSCEPARPRRRGEGDVPVTGVSFEDAMAYAGWLSSVTGQTWRLPTVAEWVFAAGSQAVDPALDRVTDGSNPADRWLAYYEKEASLGDAALASPEPLGAFGPNEFGVADLTGSVWEWTASCDGRTVLDAEGAIVSRLQSCGVRYLEGRHRAPMSSFVRDARSGGCAVGAPPDNLGFRLVRERNPLARAMDLLRGMLRL